MSSHLRPLLAKPAADPAAESHDATTDPPDPGPSSGAAPARLEPRQCVGAACDTCRLKKTKCDAARPVCSTCRKRGWMCYYATMPGETRNKSLKREVGKLRAASEELSRLFDYLRLADRPEADAALEQIRNGLSPHEVLSAMGALSPFLHTPGPGLSQDPRIQQAQALPGGGWGHPAPLTRGGSLDDMAAPALAAHGRYAMRPVGPHRGYPEPLSQHAEAAPWPIPPTTKSTPGPMDPPASAFPTAPLRPWPPGSPDDVVMPASL